MAVVCVNETTALSSIHFCSRMPKKTYEKVRSTGLLTRQTSVRNGACQLATRPIPAPIPFQLPQHCATDTVSSAVFLSFQIPFRITLALPSPLPLSVIHDCPFRWHTLPPCRRNADHKIRIIFRRNCPLVAGLVPVAMARFLSSGLPVL